MVMPDIIDLSATGTILTRVVQVIGGIIVLYVIVWIINIFLSRNKNRLLKKILVQVEQINQKLDKVVKSKRK